MTYRAAKFDEHGIEFEFLLLLIVIAPVVGVIIILMVVDPGEYFFKRVFAWPWMFFYCYLTTWTIMLGFQIFKQWNSDRTKRNTKVDVGDMRVVCNNNPQLKKQFHEYAKKQYVAEMINYVEDVGKYKALFYEKAENWRRSKFRTLVENYIVPGSNFEINISHLMRNRILEVYESQSTQKDLYTVFDESLREVERLLQNGVWKDFIFKTLPENNTGVKVGNTSLISSQH